VIILKINANCLTVIKLEGDSPVGAYADAPKLPGGCRLTGEAEILTDLHPTACAQRPEQTEFQKYDSRGRG